MSTRHRCDALWIVDHIHCSWVFCDYFVWHLDSLSGKPEALAKKKMDTNGLQMDSKWTKDGQSSCLSFGQLRPSRRSSRRCQMDFRHQAGGPTCGSTVNRFTIFQQKQNTVYVFLYIYIYFLKKNIISPVETKTTWKCEAFISFHGAQKQSKSDEIWWYLMFLVHDGSPSFFWNPCIRNHNM